MAYKALKLWSSVCVPMSTALLLTLSVRGPWSAAMAPLPLVPVPAAYAWYPLLYVYIPSALSDTSTCLDSGTGQKALDPCLTTTYGQPSHMLTAS